MDTYGYVRVSTKEQNEDRQIIAMREFGVADSRIVLVKYNGTDANVVIPSGVTAIGASAFEKNMTLKSVTIPAGVKTIGNRAFMNCVGLQSVSLPDGLVTIGDCAFDNCHSMPAVNIPGTVTGIGENAFASCSALKSVAIPSGVKRISSNTFTRCTGLTSVTIQNGVTIIERDAFRGCSRLASVTIPTSVTSVGDCAFSGCAKLMDVYYEGSEAQWLKIDGYINLQYKLEDGSQTMINHFAGGTGSETTPGSTPSSASSWAREQVSQAIAAGLVPSTLQSRYTQSITRQEFCALANAVYQKVKGDVTPTASFSDTSDPIVLKMATVGVVNGVGNNRFDPSGKLTREQAATMLYRLAAAAGKPLPDVNATFADKGAVSSWASKAVGAVQAAGIMNGVGNSRFDPKGAYTIEQSIVTMLRMYRYLNQ